MNKHYKCMEIDIDGVMKSMLLLKKKKYAALMIGEEWRDGASARFRTCAWLSLSRRGALVQTLTRETKGLDLVRRDWCTLSREAGSKVLDFILSGKPREEIVSDIQAFLREIASKIKNNALGIEQYVVTKALTKAPGDDPDAKNQPHVQVAKAMMEQGTPIGAGTVVEYVICVDTGKAGVADRCPRESSRRSPPSPSTPLLLLLLPSRAPRARRRRRRPRRRPSIFVCPTPLTLLSPTPVPCDCLTPGFAPSRSTQSVSPENGAEAEGLLQIDTQWYLAQQVRARLDRGHRPSARHLTPADGDRTAAAPTDLATV